jgi:hypothetical protein
VDTQFVDAHSLRDSSGLDKQRPEDVISPEPRYRSMSWIVAGSTVV